jgi:hypothetical protein
MDWNQLAVAVLGGLVGFTELAQRYRDDPMGPVFAFPGLLYVAINAGASVAALWFVQYVDGGVAAASTASFPTAIKHVLLAGFGAMAFFRSAFFTVRIGDRDFPVGPAALLQVLLNISDRAYDRDRAADRSKEVGRIMAGISFERAKQTLPAYCLQLMQNVGKEEADKLVADVQQLDASAMSPRSKSNNLGLLVMGVVGRRTLDAAVNALRSIIELPSESDRKLLALAKGLPLASSTRLLAQCKLLDPDRPAAAVTALEQAVAGILASADPDDAKAIAVVAALRALYGSAVLEAALAKP